MISRARRGLLAPNAVLWLFAAACAVWLLTPIVEVALLGFAGILLGIFLHTAGRYAAERLHVPARVGVGLVCMALLALTVGGGWLAAPAVAQQAHELASELPRALQSLVERVEATSWGQQVVSQATSLLQSDKALTRAPRVLSSTLGAVVSLLAFTLMGLFVALEPQTYIGGALRLVAPQRRPHVREVLADVAHALRLWMIAKLGAMLFVGVATWLGLVLLGSPLALALACIAAGLTFIPNFGPVVAAVPAVLLGLRDGLAQAGYVVLLYLGVQLVESYFLTPLLERRTVSLPPALTVIAQLAMGAAVGGIGVLIATPLLATCVVLVRRFYVEDVLERPSKLVNDGG